MQTIVVFLAAVALAVAAESSLFNAEAVSPRFASRIANGNAAGLNQFPYQVSVVSSVGSSSPTVCGGALISSTWVLTAAHCTQTSQLTIRIGSINLWGGGVTQTSFQYVVHPEYSRDVNKDISLVRLPSPVGFTDAIQPVRLPTISQSRSTFAGFQGTVSGWGSTAPGENVNTALLRWVFMRVITNAECARVYGTRVVGEHVLCGVGFESTNQGSCVNDHGSPFTINEGGVINTLIGVTSFEAGNGCFLGYPSGFMRVTSFHNWILSVTGIQARP